jgi:hypothetical protein
MAPASEDTEPTGQYCPNCGEPVDSADKYCGSCGHGLGESPGGTTDRESRAHRQFRQRVVDHVNDGWTIEYDGGDEVAMVDRGYGSIGVHILLLLFTSGIGNALYGWYHYEHSAERKVLRASGPDRTPTGQPAEGVYEQDASTDSSLSDYFWGLLLGVIAVAIFASSWTLPVKLAAGFACLFMAGLLLPPVQRRLDERHPVTTFGPTTSVDERFVSETDRACSVCLDRIEDGVKREYEETYMFAGVPLYTIDRGENLYCDDCHSDVHQFQQTESLDAKLGMDTDNTSAADPSQETAAADSTDAGAATSADSGEREAAGEES